MINIRKLEAELWESADLLRQGSKLTSSQYCMPVLALLFLRYAYSRYKIVEAEILENRPKRGGRVMPVEPSDFAAKSALFLPREAQFDYLVNLPDDIIAAKLKTKNGQDINSLGEAVNNAMQLVVAANGKFEICALKPSGSEWMRVSGTLVNDETLSVKETFLERNPSLKAMYKADDDNMAVLYITNGVARFCSFAAPERKVAF